LTKFDDATWHESGPAEGGYPPENASAHIGLYLGWLIRTDRHNREAFTTAWVAAVKAGDMTGSDLMDAIDGKLVAEVMTPDAAAFTNWYYDRYPADLTATFDAPDYGIADDAASLSAIVPVIESRFAEWISLGKPEPATGANLGSQPSPVAQIEISLPARSEWSKFPIDTQKLLEEELREAQARGWRVELHPGPAADPHQDPELEALIPHDVTHPPMRVTSVRASDWQSSILNRVLKRLGIRTRDATVASGIGGEGEAVVTATAYRVPGIARSELWSELPSLVKQPGMRCADREVEGRQVMWCTAHGYVIVGLAGDGVVVVVAGRDEHRLAELVVRVLSRVSG
jgi:hypothetical protein